MFRVCGGLKGLRVEGFEGFEGLGLGGRAGVKALPILSRKPPGG